MIDEGGGRRGRKQKIQGSVSLAVYRSLQAIAARQGWSLSQTIAWACEFAVREYARRQIGEAADNLPPLPPS